MGRQKRENKFQHHVKQRLRNEFPGCIVTKLDANDIQGIPDLLVLYNEHWAALECKQHAKAKHRPNQDRYVEKMNQMSYASFIFPENEEVVFDGLKRSFGA